MHWWQGAFTSISKSQSRDDSIIPSDHGKPGFFSSRRHRLLSRAKKLLQPIDVGSPGHFRNLSARPASGSSNASASASASPLPLPLPEQHHRDPKLAAAPSTSVPLPSPDAVKLGKECEDRDRETAEPPNAGTTDRHDEHKSRKESRKERENGEIRKPAHGKTTSLESFISAPCSPYASPARNDMWGTAYHTTPPPSLFQVWSAPEPDSHHTHTISLDNSPLHSPRPMPTAAVHPLPLPPPPVSLHTPVSPIPASSPAALHLPINDLKLTPTSPAEVMPIKSKWQKGKLIGRGTFGSVYVASNRETGALCAMKEVEILPDDSKSAECMRQLEQEIQVLSRLKHQNIVQYYGSEIVDDKFYIYLEYVHPGSINKFIHDHCGAITESVVRNFTRHILFGLAYLHSQKTIHRDIKCANLLVDAYGVVKLADFGMAKHLSGQTAFLSLKGSPYWMAPELLQSEMQTDATSDIALAVDIWSLGCTIIEMMDGKPPWSEYEGPAALFKVLKETPPVPETMSAEGKDFLQCCFRRSPAERPSATRLLDHPFVNYSNPLEAAEDNKGKLSYKLSLATSACMQSLSFCPRF